MASSGKSVLSGTYVTASMRVSSVEPKKDSTTAWVGTKGGGASTGASPGLPAHSHRVNTSKRRSSSQQDHSQRTAVHRSPFRF